MTDICEHNIYKNNIYRNIIININMSQSYVRSLRGSAHLRMLHYSSLLLQDLGLVFVSPLLSRPLSDLWSELMNK